MTLPEHARQRLLALGAGLPDPGSRWRILREVGRGGMGVVYEAEDLHLHRRVALKVLEGTSSELRERFAREAAAAARLSHPNIAAVYDATADAIAMQFVAGRPLSEESSRDLRRLVRLVRDAARAVHHAHSHGLVHRDLKPGNLLVEGDTVFVVDFGLAKDTAADGTLSGTGGLLGTPSYMAPEQALGRHRAIDARTDVYGLGATLYACATGRPPFADKDLGALLRAIVEREPPPARVDPDLDVVLQKAMSKEPERRYADAAAFADDLERWLAGLPVRARAPSVGYRFRKFVQRRRALLRATAAAAIVATVVTGAVLLPELSRQRAVTDALQLSWRCAGILQDAQLHMRRGRVAAAQQCLDRGIEQVRAFVASNDVARAHQLLGRLLRARGKSEEARAAFDRALALDPSLAAARFERGLCLIESDPEQAIEDLATPVDGENLPQCDLDLGRAERHRLLGELETARDLLLEVTATDPVYAPAWLSLSKVWLGLGDGDQAMRCAVRAFDIHRGFGPAYEATPRASTVLELELPGIEGVLIDVDGLLAGRQNDALAFAHVGLECLRRAASALRNGEVEEALHDCEDALQQHHAALQSLPELASLHNNRGVAFVQRELCLRRLGRSAEAGESREQARSDFELALHHETNQYAARRNLASSHFREAQLALGAGDPSAALAAATRAADACSQSLSTRERDVAVLLLRASALALMSEAGDESASARALADCDEVLRLRARHPSALYLRGRIELARGERDAARADLRAALLAAPIDWSEAAECQRDLAAAEQESADVVRD